MQPRAWHDDFAQSNISFKDYRPPNQTLRILKASVACAKGQEVCPPERLNAYWWQVETGAARKVLLLPSGRRCVMEFFFPGDFLCMSLVWLRRYRRGGDLRGHGPGALQARGRRAPRARRQRHRENAAATRLFAQHFTWRLISSIFGINAPPIKCLLFLLKFRSGGKRPNEFVSLPMSR